MKTITLATILGLTRAVLRKFAGLAAVGLTAETKLSLTASPEGRIVLHLLCACRDHRFQWHWRGVVREFFHV